MEPLICHRMGMRRALPWILGVVILTVVLVVGLSQAGGGRDDTSQPDAAYDLNAARRQLEGSPAPLAALNGTPVVINKWASWCNPCRAEFPAFQQLATERGRRIAFLGVNSGDSTRPARKFLADYPVPFPSYVDPDERIARAIKAPANYPVTVFVDARGETAFIHQGGYTSVDRLEADVDRYLG